MTRPGISYYNTCFCARINKTSVLVHPEGISEISDLCGNISNFRLNVSLWEDVDIASFWEIFFRNL